MHNEFEGITYKITESAYGPVLTVYRDASKAGFRIASAAILAIGSLVELMSDAEERFWYVAVHPTLATVEIVLDANDDDYQRERQEAIKTLDNAASALGLAPHTA